MKKLILGLVAAAAVVTPMAMAAGSANAATTDANGVVTVSKGEIMAQFPGMNEKSFQGIAMADGQSLTGSNVFTATTTTGVGCSDGTVQTHFRSTITSPITLTEIYNGSADKVTGWNLGGKGVDHHRGQRLRQLVVGPLPGLRHHLCRTRLRDELLCEPRPEPQRRGGGFTFDGRPSASSRSTRTWPRPSEPPAPTASRPFGWGGVTVGWPSRPSELPNTGQPRPPKVGGLLDFGPDSVAALRAMSVQPADELPRARLS